MQTKLRWIAILLAIVATRASAHELSCRETLNGKTILVVSTYPTTIEVSVTITNDRTDADSVATKITSALFPANPPLFQTPLDLAPGDSHTASFTVTVNSQAECESLAARLLDTDHLLTSVDVLWDMGEAECSAELVCESAVCQ